MSHILSIRARGFKGCDFSEELAPVTVLTGPNATGKSARMEALLLWLLGYLPTENPEKPIQAARLIHDLYASAPTMSVGGSWAQHGDRTWSPANREGSIRYSGPQGPLLPPHALDAGAYLAMTGPERLRFLLKCSDGAGEFSGDKLAKVVSSRLSELGADAASVAAAEKDLKFGSPSDALALLHERLRQMQSEAAAAVKRMRSTLLGLTATAVPASFDPEAERKAEASRVVAEQARIERSRLAHKVEQARAEYRKASALAAGFDEAARAQAEIDQEESAKTLASMEAEVLVDRREWARLAKEKDSAGIDLSIKEIHLSGVEQRKAETISNTKCHACGHVISKTKRAKLLSELTEQAVAAEKERLAAFEAAAEAKRLFVAEDNHINFRESHNSAYRAASAKAASAAKTLLATAAAAEAKARLPALEADGMILLEALRRAEADVAAAAETERQAAAAAKQVIAYRADQAARARAEEELERCLKSEALHKAACEMLAELQKQLVGRAVGPLMAKANALCSSLLPGPLVFVDGEFFCEASARRSPRSLSDSEKLAMNAALAFAVASVSKATLRLAIIGRLESFDRVRKPALVRLALELVRTGELDQALLVEVEGAGSPDEEYKEFTADQNFRLVRVQTN